ncbi:Predicted Zn-dependent peptidase [Sporobacter termitidis DSM 10068]|uniref:Predicted Zn-dependent peptidase n=1 Tax=Sporobacter termitidis DSM 10068 TaxID=1123282 RepID=A0A1M5Y4A0_9FIRM|nr:pitrilysin family protein [Sporobacter termitidis]SHI06796.1 Predicted Zn-dependent peptidase [Sporobacter termitidis DSM 10068]
MYEKIVLPNGVRILHEYIPYVRSVSLGIWVATGARYEDARMNGASHFIEHMLFKGTETRSAEELAVIMDTIGGQTNAFTTKECTCFHGRVLDTHLPLLSDVLCDMFFHSKFAEEDVANERGVILEEIDMYQDTPEDLATERLSSAVFKGFSLARPILGTKSTLGKMTGETLRDYMAEHYRPDSVVVAVSGSYKPEDIAQLRDIFSAMPHGGRNSFNNAVYTPTFTVKRKSLEQNHLNIAFPGVAVTDNSRFTLQLLSDILGGGMSSRLFQTVREKRGLCYTVYSYGSSYIDTGLFSIYTALGRETELEAVRVIVEEIKRFKEAGVTQEELRRAREQVKANVLMGLESTATRMNRLGRNELYFGAVPEPDEIIARYDSVAADDIQKLAAQCLDLGKASFSAVGKVDNAEVYRELFAQ